MANRLKPWLPDLIAPQQSAFVNEIAPQQSAFMNERQIQDNILIVQEMLHQPRVRQRKRKFQAVLKLDM